MNTANKLTMLRVALIPVYLVVLYWGFPGAAYAALAIFIIASLTDFVDGYIARHYNQTTDFGKFMDPLADKVLVLAAMLWFCQAGRLPAWALVIVVAREFAVSGLRLVAVDNGRGHRGRLVGEGQNLCHHGVPVCHASAGAPGGGLCVRGGDCRHHPVLRGGVLCEE